ncbi:MAG: hypothetical protein EOM85_03920 [Candidatus Moranbacteria bacterium]|nr:hypothetical protein [Candidatus Moranbacteria bacterium]
MPKCEYLEKTGHEASNEGIAIFTCKEFGHKWSMYILNNTNTPSGSSGINVNAFKECFGCEHNKNT